MIFSIFLAAVVVVLLSGHSEAYPARPESHPVVPAVIEHDGGVLRLSDIGGDDQRVSVTLWSSDNAASRAANALRAAEARRDSTLTHIGVNVDPSEEIYREILRRDRLDGDSLQLHIRGREAARLLATMGYTTLSAR